MVTRCSFGLDINVMIVAYEIVDGDIVMAKEIYIDISLINFNLDCALKLVLCWKIELFAI